MGSTMRAVEYDLAMKTSEVLTQAVTWMDLGNIMLSEKACHQRLSMYFMILFMSNVQKRQMQVTGC